MTQLSTGLRDSMMTVAPFATALGNCIMNFYSGTIPASADAALPSDALLLCTISDAGAGGALHWEAASAGGVLAKSSSQVWRGTCVATGNATWWSMQLPADSGAATTTGARMQGTLAVIGADINLSSVNLVTGAIQTLDYFVVAVPASV
ncbi:MAG: hypothetical protein ACOH2R_08565 [Pseudomonas sp.]